MPGTDLARPSKGGKRQKGPTSEWNYRIPVIIGSFGSSLGLIFLAQALCYWLKILPYSVQNKPIPKGVSLFSNYGLFPLYLLIFVIVTPLMAAFLYKKFHAIWFNNNALYLTDDLPEHDDDAYIRSIADLAAELDVAPDAGLGFNGHASTLMSHMMVSNKGIKKVEMPVYDGSVDGYIKRDADGKIVKKLVPMFDQEFGDMLFSMSGVPMEARKYYDARDYDFNRKLTRKEGGGKDKNGHYKRAGAYGRKEYDKLSDVINGEFYPLDSETQRPAGVYFYDSRPVNTILIAITRGGKANVCSVN